MFQVPLGFSGSQDPRVLLPDDKTHAIYQWSSGHEQGPAILDKLSMWAYDTAKLLMAEAGLDERKWAPYAPCLVFSGPNATQGPPHVEMSAPAYQAVLHLSCCSEKTLVYQGESVGFKDALKFIKFDRGDCKDDDDDFRLKRPLAAAHVDLVKNMCQARPFLEKGMRPWKGSSPQDKWCSAMSAVVFEANLVQAHPPKPKTHPAAQRQCTVCKAGSGPSGDVKFYTVFIPTGSMSPSFSYDPEIQYKAWDVAFSPQLYPRTYEDDEKRRQLQTGRHIDLCQEYADYFPEKSCGRDEEPELHVKDMLEALKNFGETRPVPDVIKDARHY